MISLMGSWREERKQKYAFGRAHRVRVGGHFFYDTGPHWYQPYDLGRNEYFVVVI